LRPSSTDQSNTILSSGASDATDMAAAVLSVITGGGRWAEIKTQVDPLYQHLIVTAERKFWRCVENGEPPRLFGAEPPRPRTPAASKGTLPTRRRKSVMSELPLLRLKLLINLASFCQPTLNNCTIPNCSSK